MAIAKFNSLKLIQITLSSLALCLFCQYQTTATPAPRSDWQARTKGDRLDSALEPIPPLLPLETPNTRPNNQTESPIRLVLKLRQRRVYLYKGDRVQVSYPVGVGRAGWETPRGTFSVQRMLRNPTWEHPWTGALVPPGPENPLGNRWIGFWTDGRNQIGFHGTTQENLIGQAVSHGCVRMRNRDVQALFEQVTVGTPVIVQP